MKAEAYKMFQDPVAWGEHFLVNRDGSRFRYWEHQVEDLRCKAKHAVHLDGRDVGKTFSITTHALHFAFITPGGRGLVVAPFQGQLDLIIGEIEYQLEKVPLLAEAVARHKNGNRKIKRRPYFQVDFANGAVLYFRPAGAYGNAYRSLHVHRIWVDEGAWLSDQAWRAMGGCLLKGGRRRIYSTPNGVRSSQYYRFTTNTPGYKVYRWPSWLNPNWCSEHEEELITFYGGKNSIGWQHEVAGEHGKQAYGAFNIDHLAICTRKMPEYTKIVITDAELAGCTTEAESWDRLEMLMNLCPRSGAFWIGGDLGYTNDPTELVVFEDERVDNQVFTRLVVRLHMEHVTYPHITQALAILNRFFEPKGIGVDNGANGTSVVQNLLTLDTYRDSGFEERLVGYDFGGKVEVPGPERDEWTDDGWCRIRRKVRKMKPRWTKEYMTELITRELTSRTIVLPTEDPEVADQFSSQTYSITENRIRYSKGNDHIVDAVRCAMLVRDQKRNGAQKAVPDGVRRIQIDHVPILPLEFPSGSGF